MPLIPPGLDTMFEFRTIGLGCKGVKCRHSGTDGFLVILSIVSSAAREVKI